MCRPLTEDERFQELLFKVPARHLRTLVLKDHVATTHDVAFDVVTRGPESGGESSVLILVHEIGSESRSK